MNNRGRKKTVPWDRQLAAFQKHKEELLDENKQIKSSTHEVYSDLSDELGMSRKAIQLAITRSKDEIFGVGVVTNPNKYYKPADDDEDFEPDSIHHFDFKTTISVNLPTELQFHFQNITVKGPSRDYVCLRPSWPDALFRIIARETGSECCINFKRSMVSGEEFSANGECSECGGTVYVQSRNKRTILLIEMKEGNKPHSFTHKRRLTHDKARMLRSQLEKDTAHNVLLAAANDISDDQRFVPRDLVTAKSLHNLKSSSNASKGSCMQEIFNMMFSIKFDGIIKRFEPYPLNIIFWSKQQIYYYAQLSKTQPLRISIDATGGMVTKCSMAKDLKVNDEKKIYFPHVFLYIISVKNANGPSCLVGQMLSAVQDSMEISYFLKRWAEDFKPPAEITMDDSAALLKACVTAFTSYATTAAYVSACFHFLNGISTELPMIYIRLDIAHFIKNLVKHKELKKVDYRVKKAYLNIVGVIIQSDTFDNIKKIIKHALILALYPMEGVLDDGSKLPTAESLSTINKLVRSHDISFVAKNANCDTNNAEDEDEDDAAVMPDNEQELRTNISWYMDIYNEVAESIKSQKLAPNHLTSNTRENMLHCPEAHHFFKDIMERLPLWSAVMSKHFSSSSIISTSNDTESRFKVLKRNVFANFNLPIRADIFCAQMFNVIAALAKLNYLLDSTRCLSEVIVYFVLISLRKFVHRFIFFSSENKNRQNVYDRRRD